MSEPRITAYIGLGSNLQHPREQVEGALRELGELPDTRCTARSSLYRSDPVGPQDQPDFINAVARLDTRLSAQALLEACQRLEQRHQRRRDGERWGPRTLDLDLLLYAGQHIDTPDLIVPHPRMAERAFVLVPLAEIAPSELLVPGMGRLRALLDKVDTQGVQRLF